MNSYHSSVQPIVWVDDHLQLLDQRKLPHEYVVVDCYTCDEVVHAIREMVVRGAPAIGVTAAYGVVLAARQAQSQHAENWRGYFTEHIEQLRAARPTAVNLVWAIDQMLATVEQNNHQAEQALLAAAKRLHREDVAINQKMGDLGAELVTPSSAVITPKAVP